MTGMHSSQAKELNPLQAVVAYGNCKIVQTHWLQMCSVRLILCFSKA